MSDYKVVSSNILYTGSNATNWNNVDSILYDGLLAYSPDTKEFRLGNGVDAYEDLPIIFNLNDQDRMQDLMVQIPSIFTSEDIGKLLIVNADGTGYMLSDIKLSELLTRDYMESILSGYSSISHYHEEYPTKAEVSSMIVTNTVVSMRGQDTISYLLLAKLDRESEQQLDLPDGFADEFETTDYIDMDNSNITHLQNYVTNASFSGEGSFNLQSKVYEDNNLINDTRVLFRGILDDLVPNKDVVAEVSRDGGITWTAVPLEKSILSGDIIGIYSGSGAFDKILNRSIIDLSTADIEDIKDDATSFTIDLGGAIGHFNAPISKLTKGCKIYSDTNIWTITSVTGDGTDIGSVGIDVVVPISTYPIQKVSPIEVGSANIKLNENVSTSSFYTVTLPIPHESLATLYNISNSVSCAIRQGNDFLIFKDNVWKSIVRLNNNIWQYRNAAGSFSNVSVNTMHNALSTAMTLSENRMTCSELSQVSLIALEDITELALGFSGSEYNGIISNIDCIYMTNVSSLSGFKYVYRIRLIEDNITASLPDMLFKHGAFPAAAQDSQNRIYVTGGLLDGVALNIVERYDPNLDQWIQLTSMPYITRSHGMVVDSNDNVFVVGGYPPILGSVIMYNPINNTWISKANMNTPRQHPGVVIDSQNRIYAIGGYVDHNQTNSRTTNSAEVYDPTTNSWSNIASMNYPRAGASTVISKSGHIYVIGGGTGDNSGQVTYNERYNPDTNTWTILAPMPVGLSVKAAHIDAANKYIYVFGPVIYKYSIIDNTWSIAMNSMSTNQLAKAVSHPSNKLVYLIGGGGDTTETAITTTQVFKLDSAPLQIHGVRVKYS